MATEIQFQDIAELRNERVDPKTCPDAFYIGLEHIEQQSLRLGGHAYGRDADSQKQKFYKGDILFGKLRPYFRKVVIAPFDGICSTDIWVVRPKGNSSLNFIYYWMASAEFIRSSTHASEGGRMPRAKWDWVSEFTSEIVDQKEQEAIGEYLQQFDLRIQENLKMSTELEEIAMGIFHKTFSDSSTKTTIGKYATLGKSMINPQKNLETEFVHYSIPSFDSQRFPVRELGSEIQSSKFIIDSSCLLISKLNPQNERKWLVLNPPESSICSTEFIVLKPKNLEVLPFLFALSKTQDFQTQFVSWSTGSTGSRQRVRPDEILDYEFTLPDEVLLKEYAKVTSPMFEFIAEKVMENLALMKLRDLFIERLYSGQITNLKSMVA